MQLFRAEVFRADVCTSSCISPATFFLRVFVRFCSFSSDFWRPGFCDEVCVLRGVFLMFFFFSLSVVRDPSGGSEEGG